MTLHEWIDRQLHKVFDQPAKEPLPEQMQRLLDTLEKNEEDSGRDERR